MRKMLKEIADDYFKAFYLSRVVEMLKTDMAIWSIIIYPVILFIFYDGKGGNDYIIFPAIYLPVLFILFSMNLHPVRLHKMMYLCPMEASVRKAYVRYSYFFRIVVQMSVVVIGIAVIIPFSHFDMVLVVEILLNDLVMGILIPEVKKTGGNSGGTNKEMVYRVVMILMPLFLNLGQMGALSDSEFHVIVKLVNAGCLVMILLPLFGKYWKYVQDELASAVYYEEEWGGV